jgi:short-subunit dehydrogenase
MPKTDRLKILNLSSFAADVNPPGLSIYSSTKLALENLVQNIQQESFNKVLTCNLVLGPVASQMLQNIVDKKAKSFFEKSVQNAMKKKLQKTEPLSAESVARLAIDLLERDPWVTRCVANRELMTEINASRLAVRGLEVVYEPT